MPLSKKQWLLVSASLAGVVFLSLWVWLIGFIVNRPKPVVATITEKNGPIEAASPALVVNTPNSPAPHATEGSGDTPIRNEAQRLARASEVRHYLRDQNIPATVVASGSQLSVQYEVASGDYLPEIFQTFCRQQSVTNLRAAGFETIEIRARDSFGNMKSNTFALNECIKR